MTDRKRSARRVGEGSRGSRKAAERVRTEQQKARTLQLRKEIGARLGELRRLYNVEQLEIAAEINISPQRWHNYEAGKRPLDVEIVFDLCQRFDVHADWLLLGKGPVRPLPKK
jgi:DNA-binding XRE family transcriptional regulator